MTHDPARNGLSEVVGYAEDLEDEAYERLKDDDLGEHETGFYRGQKKTAKRLRILAGELRMGAPTRDPEGLVTSLERHLERLEYEATGPRFGPATNGFAYAKIPDWLLRQVIFRLRSHTDREPDTYCVKDEAGEVVYMDVWLGAPLERGHTLHEVYIGPPVQPEEEEDGDCRKCGGPIPLHPDRCLEDGCPQRTRRQGNEG